MSLESDSHPLCFLRALSLSLSLPLALSLRPPFLFSLPLSFSPSLYPSLPSSAYFISLSLSSASSHSPSLPFHLHVPLLLPLPLPPPPPSLPLSRSAFSSLFPSCPPSLSTPALSLTPSQTPLSHSLTRAFAPCLVLSFALSFARAYDAGASLSRTCARVRVRTCKLPCAHLPSKETKRLVYRSLFVHVGLWVSFYIYKVSFCASSRALILRQQPKMHCVEGSGFIYLYRLCTLRERYMESNSRNQETYWLQHYTCIGTGRNTHAHHRFLKNSQRASARNCGAPTGSDHWCAISNGTSPQDVRSGIGRLTKRHHIITSSHHHIIVRFEIGQWCHVRSQNKETSNLKKSENK